MKKAKELYGLKIEATDGRIGHLEDLFFDDVSWTIRYFVVDIGFWILGRKVLVSPVAVKSVDWDEGVIQLVMNKEEINASPDINTEKPVSRQLEEELISKNNWPIYWGRMGKAIAEDEGIEKEETPSGSGDPNLRSTKELAGYFIQARDGNIGEVQDFLVEDDQWIIRYIIYDSGKWLAQRQGIFSPMWLENILWGRRSISVPMDSETVKTSPEYDHSAPLDREYEKKIFDHYNKTPYWE